MYKDEKIEEFIKKLSSSDSMPGGGVASSLVAANGISLTIKVCNLTIGKEKYKQYNDLIEETKKIAEDLKNKFLILMDKDAEEFKNIEQVFKMPNVTFKEKEERKKMMQIACKKCSIIPKEIIENIIKGIEITERIVGKSNKSAASDLEIGKILLKAAAKSAWENIESNLKYIDDEEFVKEQKKFKTIVEIL